MDSSRLEPATTVEPGVSPPGLRELVLRPEPIKPYGVPPPRCLPCRRRKKKCDRIRPTCGNCARSRGQDICTMAIAKTRGRKPLDVQTGSDELKPAPQLLPPDAADFSLSLIVPKTSPIVHSPGGLSEIPHTVTQVSGQTCITMLQEVVGFFQQRIIMGNVSYNRSVMAMTLPHVMEDPTLFHAYIANMSTIRPGLPPYWQERCMVHYNHAVKGLMLGLQGSEPPSAWPSRQRSSTMILLHMFEASQSAQTHDDVQLIGLSSAHLKAANRVFMATMNKPMTPMEVQFCEGYILRVAYNHMFHPDCLPYEYLAQLLAAWETGLAQAQLAPTREVSSRLHLGPDLFNMIYKISWLNDKRPLRSKHLVDGVRFVRALSDLSLDDGIHADLSTQEGQNTVLILAYRAACLCLADDIVNEEHQGNGRNTMPFVLGTRILDRAILHLPGGALASFLWPLIIIGALASEAQAQSHFTEMAARLSLKLGSGSVDRIQRFWATVWRDLPKSPFTDRQALSSILI